MSLDMVEIRGGPEGINHIPVQVLHPSNSNMVFVANQDVFQSTAKPE